MPFWKKSGDSRASERVPFQEIVEGANDAILVVHASSGEILYANPAIQKLLNIEPKDLIRQPFMRICAADAVARSAELIADAWEADGAISMELTLCDSAGAKVPVEVSTRVDRFSGQPAVILYVRDIRERLRLLGIIEAQNQKLLESIQYARRLQSAALPPPSEVEALLPESFLIYLPKDIVSGDFYWVAQRDGYTYLCVGDCTGHGVPGAMMVMLSLAFLNQALQSMPAPTPGQLLTRLHQSFCATLDVGQVRDGADAILIRLAPDHSSLLWASANRPFWYIKGGTLHEHRGERRALGGSTTADYVWQDCELSIDDTTRIFLSTDGYADQFGGPQGKKLMTGAFKRLLTETASLPLPQQKAALLDYFYGWKGSMEQVDDVLVVGINLKHKG